MDMRRCGEKVFHVPGKQCYHIDLSEKAEVGRSTPSFMEDTKRVVAEMSEPPCDSASTSGTDEKRKVIPALLSRVSRRSPDSYLCI